MRIDRLELTNFKGFREFSVELHPHFTLLIGENGSGKTTLLDALAVAAGIWLVNPPDSLLSNSGRNIMRNEIRLEAEQKGDRVQFSERLPVSVQATGMIGEHENVTWTRRIREGGKRTTNADARTALGYVKEIYAWDQAGRHVLCPVLAYFGAGRAWLPSNERIPKFKHDGLARRWAAFYDCFHERIRFDELRGWFQRETTERGNRRGLWRPGFEVVRRAILRCVPGSSDVWFDADLDQIVLSIEGNAQPFTNLSAGQRMMLALVADLAIKAVTQNAFLVPADELPPDEDLPAVLRQTPGLVLIDELDVHLHPKWQRRVAADLKRTFPAVQFVGATHSPQVIGQVTPEEIRVLEGGEAAIPSRSFGMDSSRVLAEVMNAEVRDPNVDSLLARLFSLIDKEDFAGARNVLPEVEARLGADDPEVTRANALMRFLESGE
ncbi:MAG: DNA replication and repair protein RecF [Bryobacteraceae bacterium]|nr:DNA replication and repair protein RecF [Bryobacteraceae bacterium]